MKACSVEASASGFWHWSLTHYPKVKAQLLCLQDEQGANVNLLLLCLYLGQKQQKINKTQCSLLTSALKTSDEKLQTLRAARRKIKDLDKVTYQNILAEELVLEKQQQQDLIQVTQAQQLTEADSALTAAQANLAIYFEHLGLVSAGDLSAAEHTLLALLN